MKKFLFRLISRILLLFILLSPAKAQRYSAELITVLPLSSGLIKQEDGERQVKVWNNYLFITNFWAGVRVMDISDLKKIHQISFLPTQAHAYYTEVDGKYAYIANHHDGIQVYNIKNPKQIFKVAQLKTPGHAYWVVSQFPYLFVAMGKNGFCIMDVSDISKPAIVSTKIIGEWTQQLFKKDHLLFLAAKTGGIFIYDISDIKNPQHLSRYETGYNSMEIQVEDDIAFIADGRGGLLVINVANPALPKEISRFTVPGFIGAFHKAGHYAYLANQSSGLQIVNIADPNRPYLEGQYNTDGKCYGVYRKGMGLFLAADNATLIMRHNNAPVLTDIDNFIIKENIPFSLKLNASEPDGDQFIYKVENLPGSASFDSKTGTMFWKPNYEESGVYKNIIFKVIEQTDSHLSVADTVSIEVENVNRRPDLASLKKRYIAENSILSFTLPKGWDLDRENLAHLSYRAEKLPEGAIFNPISRLFSWRPNYEQAGNYEIDFLVDDGSGGIDREPMRIKVSNVNRAPQVQAPQNQSIKEDQWLKFQINIFDPDLADQNKLKVRATNLPVGARFNRLSNEFAWKPAIAQKGQYKIRFQVKDSEGLSESVTVNIQVKENLKKTLSLKKKLP